MKKILNGCLLIGAVICGSYLAQAQDITSGLEGHWTFDEGGGTTSADLSGNGRDAVVGSGDPAWVSGVSGNALQFDGVDDGVNVPWYGIAGNDPRTITCWIKTADNEASTGIVGWGQSNSNGTKWHFRVNNSSGNGQLGALRTEIQGTFLIGTTVVSDDTWHFIASVFPEGGEFMVDVMHYVDGQLDVSESTNDNGTVLLVDTAASEADSDQEVRIGYRQQTVELQFYTGIIDEVRIYSRALSAEDITALYEAESTGLSGYTDYMFYK